MKYSHCLENLELLLSSQIECAAFDNHSDFENISILSRLLGIHAIWFRAG